MSSIDASKRNNIGIRFTSNQRERVKLAVLNNSNLDPSPNRLHEGTTYEKIMNLRPREKDKEIGHASFRYKP